MIFTHILYLSNYSPGFRLALLWSLILFLNCHSSFCGPEISTLTQSSDAEVAYGILCDLRLTVLLYHQSILLHYPDDLGLSITLQEIDRIIDTGSTSPNFPALLNGDLKRLALLSGQSLDVYTSRLDNATSLTDRMTGGLGVSLDSNNTMRMNDFNRLVDFHELMREMVAKRSTGELIMRRAPLCIDSAFIESRELATAADSAIYEEKIVDFQMRKLTSQLEESRVSESNTGPQPLIIEGEGSQPTGQTQEGGTDFVLSPTNVNLAFCGD